MSADTDQAELTPAQRVKANQQARAKIAIETNRMRDRLLGAGFSVHRLFELMHPVSETLIGFNYVADECVITVTLPGCDGWRDRNGRMELPMRVFPAAIERDPDLIHRLTEIVLMIHRGHPVYAHYESGGVLCGLSSGGHTVGENLNDFNGRTYEKHRREPAIMIHPQTVDKAVDGRPTIDS